MWSSVRWSLVPLFSCPSSLRFQFVLRSRFSFSFLVYVFYRIVYNRIARLESKPSAKSLSLSVPLNPIQSSPENLSSSISLSQTRRTQTLRFRASNLETRVHKFSSAVSFLTLPSLPLPSLAPYVSSFSSLFLSLSHQNTSREYPKSTPSVKGPTQAQNPISRSEPKVSPQPLLICLFACFSVSPFTPFAQNTSKAKAKESKAK